MEQARMQNSQAQRNPNYCHPRQQCATVATSPARILLVYVETGMIYFQEPSPICELGPEVKDSRVYSCGGLPVLPNRPA